MSQRGKRKIKVGVVALVAALGVGLVVGAYAFAVRGGESAQAAELAGADLVVVPEKSTADYEDPLIKVEPSGHYLDEAALEQVKGIEGVEQASPQVYLGSVGDDCCGDKVQVIGLDPDTDFTVSELLGESTSEVLAGGGVIAGSKAKVSDDSTIELFDTEVPVVARLAETGTDVDESVFGSSEELGALAGEEGASTSAVLVRLASGADAEGVRTAILEQVSGSRVA